MIRPQAAPQKREPIDWRRYAAHAHTARRRLPRDEHPLAVTLAASLVFAVAGILLLRAIGTGLGAGISDLGRSIVSTIPEPPREELLLGETAVSVSAAPILEAIPEFTQANEIRIAGKVPLFAVKPQRSVVLQVNGALVTTYPIEADGRFGGASITLADGTSTISVALVEGTTEVEASSYTVVVDRTVPAVALVRPKAGETVTGPDVIVEGKTEPGVDVTVNDRALRPNPDGTFTERLTPQPGPLKLTILARDKAGNETKTELSITVKEGTLTTSGTTLALTLDRTRVKPGETVLADVIAVEDGRAKRDLAVTLQVGVITIGTYKTDTSGRARIAFAAPDHEVEDVAVVVLGGGTSARATLTVAKKP